MLRLLSTSVIPCLFLSVRCVQSLRVSPFSHRLSARLHVSSSTLLSSATAPATTTLQETSPPLETAECTVRMFDGDVQFVESEEETGSLRNRRAVSFLISPVHPEGEGKSGSPEVEISFLTFFVNGFGVPVRNSSGLSLSGTGGPLERGDGEGEVFVWESSAAPDVSPPLDCLKNELFFSLESKSPPQNGDAADSDCRFAEEPVKVPCSKSDLTAFLRRAAGLYSNVHVKKARLESQKATTAAAASSDSDPDQLVGFLLLALRSCIEGKRDDSIVSEHGGFSGSSFFDFEAARFLQTSDFGGDVVLKGGSRRLDPREGGRRSILPEEWAVSFPLPVPSEGREEGLSAPGRDLSAALWVQILLFFCVFGGEREMRETVDQLLAYRGIPGSLPQTNREVSPPGKGGPGFFHNNFDRSLQSSRGQEIRELGPTLWQASFPDTPGIRRFLSTYLTSLQLRGLKFVDPFFPLHKDENARNEVVRVSDVFNGKHEGLYEESCHFSDVQQSRAGICQDLSSWLSIVALRPEAMREVFPFDTFRETGACIVRLWSESEREWRLVIVDDRIEEQGLKLNKRGARRSAWPFLLYKALAKVEGFYWTMEGAGQLVRSRLDSRYLLGPSVSRDSDENLKFQREIIEKLGKSDFTGFLRAMGQDVSGMKKKNFEEFGDGLRKCVERGVPLTVGNQQEEDMASSNVEYFHAYAVVGMLPRRSLEGGKEPKEDLLLISNPWGKASAEFESSRYSTDSDEWKRNTAVREWVMSKMLAEGVSLPDGITSEKIDEWRERPSAYLLPLQDAYSNIGMFAVYGPVERVEVLRYPKEAEMEWEWDCQ
uniref:Calpain catalytic domain-containing protein n=1 Tax=Chromera velia CCMP2878 TaxID=1169474 RepID=A0A0G4H3I4_9ALVE|eukprot:Cvel_5649.t1-p1 / transcript=Cvel_5649.t1 / gene=Cvel_5649 / organism=Chromera_velia_CCMP2878 / gene_product=Calpain-15, putative / transcript_product=Calpain-15, putative / location=Cvel_scaffold266:98362-100836(+) / protein_length=825 / sequence_SO=supercontig / SO=protein_coding / is_pseudo=false